MSVHDESGLELEGHKLAVGAVFYKAEGTTIKKGETLVTWEPHSVPVITEREGVIDFRDMIQGIVICLDLTLS